MTQRVCEKCGAAMAPSASFCPACDTFVDWHVDEGVASVRAADTPGASDPGGRTVDESEPEADRTAERPLPLQRDHVVAPAASLQQAEVVVGPEAPGSVELVVKNESAIVDSYVIRAADPPSWLTVTHSDANLLPGVVGNVTVIFAIAPDALAVAQRLTVPLIASSSVDPTCVTRLSVEVVVPPSGPAATVVAQPNLLRLQDSEQGRFDLHLDNRAANHAREYRLTATDPERLVRFEFAPAVVAVPAGGTADAAVHFTSPAPPAGADHSRQLTVTATDGSDEVTVSVTVAQSTSPPPDSLPVRLRLEPARVSMVDTVRAEVTVVLDNRGGHEPATFTISGRDPSHQVRFHFQHTRVSVRAGNLGHLRLVVETPAPPRGETDTRPISVLAVADDGEQIEVNGTLEVTSRPAAISLAQLRVHPEHLVVSGRRGIFTVDVDNRQGAEPLPVHLSGADEYGRAHLTFKPAQLVVPPGQVGRTQATIRHARPAAGASSSRQVRVMATSGADSVHDEATFTQHTTDRRRLWGVLLVLLGAGLVVLGAVVWAVGPALEGAEQAVRSVVDDVAAGVDPDIGDARTSVAAGLLGLLLLCAALMLLGLTSRTGRMVRTAAIVAGACGIGILVATTAPNGAGFAVTGAVVAFIGGILLRPAA